MSEPCRYEEFAREMRLRASRLSREALNKRIANPFPSEVDEWDEPTPEDFA